jgi:hypothetical protein
VVGASQASLQASSSSSLQASSLQASSLQTSSETSFPQAAPPVSPSNGLARYGCRTEDHFRFPEFSVPVQPEMHLHPHRAQALLGREEARSNNGQMQVRCQREMVHVQRALNLQEQRHVFVICKLSSTAVEVLGLE